MQSIRDLLDKALLAVAEGYSPKPEQRLTAFFPVKGSRYAGELMVVGRALNWQRATKEWLPEEALRSTVRSEILDDVIHLPWEKHGCPMSWVSVLWGTPQGEYSGAKSSFWRVVREVANELRVADTAKPDWPSSLILSNLYKISPAQGNSCPDRLCKIQERICVEMLSEEIVEWKPRRILLLTDLDWVAPFLLGLGFSEGTWLNEPLPWVGRIRFASSRDETTVVVGPHPARHRGGDKVIIAQIVYAFRGNGNEMPMAHFRRFLA